MKNVPRGKSSIDYYRFSNRLQFLNVYNKVKTKKLPPAKGKSRFMLDNHFLYSICDDANNVFPCIV